MANADGRRSPSLDGLRERLQEYHELGARFAKWRATYSIVVDDELPSNYCIWTGTRSRGAALCREAGLVPIVEPEVLMEGTHTIHDSFKATSRVLFAVYTELRDQRVSLEALLKPNMVLAGYDSDEQPSRTTRSPRRRSVVSASACPRRCRDRCSCPASQSDEQAVAAERDERARTIRGSSRSPTGARCRRRAEGVEWANPRTSRPGRRPTTGARSSAAPRAAARTCRRGRRRRRTSRS